jgi:hypothetical protein
MEWIGGLMPNLTEPGKPTVTLTGTVGTIIPANSVEGEKAQIAVEDAEHLYKELRVENGLKDEHGKEMALKPGAHVDVTTEADKDSTVPKEQYPSVQSPDEV